MINKHAVQLHRNALAGFGKWALVASVSLLTLPAFAQARLDVNKAPGGNFKLAPFKLQLPIGDSKDVTDVKEISSAELQGAGGYSNPYYFHTDPQDGAMVMNDPRIGHSTSGHPRTELRELDSWTTNGTNILNGTVKVTKVPHHTSISQIFQEDRHHKPLCELQVTKDGIVQLFVEGNNLGGHGLPPVTINTVPIGTPFSYQLQLKGSTITATVAGRSKTFTMDSSFNGGHFYFKAGNYDQTATVGAPETAAATTVKFYALKITH